MASVVKAQVVLGQITQVVDKYQEVQALLDQLNYDEPIQGNSGKFLIPFHGDGNATEWAGKALMLRSALQRRAWLVTVRSMPLRLRFPLAACLQRGQVQSEGSWRCCDWCMGRHLRALDSIV